MKILEMLFLILTIIVPSILIIIALLNLKKLKHNKKFRNTLIKIILLSFIINGFVFGVLKVHNDKTIKNESQNETSSEKKENDNMNSNVKNEGDEKDKKPIQNEGDEKNKPSDTNGKNKTSKGFEIEVKNGVTYIDGYLIVNKTYPLPSDYVPSNTHKAVSAEICQECIIDEAYDAFSKMKSDAQSQGLSLWIASGYRSYNYQKALYNKYVNRDGKVAADTYSARAGHSEHQSGYAFDLNSVSSSFANTKEGIWVNENCHKYGFIIRYPKGKETETGYKYESWHLRYIGTDLASKLYNAGDWITLEDYFGITSVYNS